MCEQTETTLRAYLGRTLGVTEAAWTIGPSPIGGRGVFATRDLQPGDLIFHDRPVVWDLTTEEVGAGAGVCGDSSAARPRQSTVMCEQTETTLRAYLGRTLGVTEAAWTIGPSPIGGRGVFATRDLQPGDLIFHDRPVVWDLTTEEVGAGAGVCGDSSAARPRQSTVMCEQTETTLRAYLGRTLGVTEAAWTIGPSPIGGRGVFATRDLQPGDLIFHDRPVVWGPRAKPDEPMCSSCGRRGRVAGCPAGCPLPVCAPDCAASSLHTRECSLARAYINLPAGGWRLDLVGIVTPLRCLFMTPEDREVVQCLQGNPGKIHGIEVDLMKRHMKTELKREEEQWMRQCCRVMDTNSFEFLRVLNDGAQTSLRGLYPLASVMNNECSPNTCHVYDADGIMKVSASRAIATGEEITTCYSVLLWSTAVRRINLANTKHFLCRCSRCADPMEFGSMLSCLPCTDAQCRGLLLPGNPLKPASPWFCGSCPMEVSAKQAAQLQAAQGSLLQTLSQSEPPTVAQFLRDSSLPAQSQVAIQLKLGLVWQLGHKAPFTWRELTQDILNLKLQCCKDILQMLETLRLGLCRMRGLILMELHAALCEQHRRSNSNGLRCQDVRSEAKSVLTSAILILQDDAAAQKELKARIEEDLQMT